MPEPIRVAAVALDAKPGRTDENIEKIAKWCVRAAGKGAKLALFPELSVTGFIPNHPTGDHAAWLREALRESRRLAERLDGRVVRRLQQVSADTGVLIAAGMLEDTGTVLHNTHVLVGSEGSLGAWRKMHVPMFEMQMYNGGGIPPVVETPLGRVGVNICFDAFLPESTRLLAVEQAEIVLFPFAADPPPVTPEGWAAWASPVLTARCGENAMFGVACNYAGEVSFAGAVQRFPGGGMVVGPSGEVLAGWAGGAGEPAMLVAELDRELLITARSSPEYGFRFRRPELYAPLSRV